MAKRQKPVETATGEVGTDATLTLEQIAGKFHTIVEEVSREFVGREELVKVVAQAILIGEHVFVLSPPGTAKTAIIRSIASKFHASFFGIQMREDTKVEELLGMWDIKALEEGSYRRRWSRAAKAQLLYVNECFKGSANALSSLLGMLHERQVDDESGYLSVPLVSALMDSNELPSEEENLSAFFDRIRYRLRLGYVASERMPELLKGATDASLFLSDLSESAKSLTMEEIARLRDGIRRIEVHAEYVDQIKLIHDQLMAKNIIISDRTWAEACGIADHRGVLRATPVKVSAFMNNRRQTQPRDFICLKDCLWTDPAHINVITDIVTEISSPNLNALTREVNKLRDQHDALKKSTASFNTTQIANLMGEALWLKGKLAGDAVVPTDQLRVLIDQVSRIHKDIVENHLRGTI